MTTTKCLNIFTREMLCYVHNIYITNHEIVIKLLRVVISRQKNNFIGKFKLEPITIYHL